MIICSHCGLEAQMNDRFCKGCGHRFSVTDGDYSAANLGSGLGTGMGASFSPSWGTSGTLGNVGTGMGSAYSAYDANHHATGASTSASTSASHVTVGVATDEAERPVEVVPSAPAPTPAPTTRPATSGRLIVRPQTSAVGEEREYLLDGQSITVGRSPSCDIVLDADQLVSRRHALLKFDGGRYVLVDLGSSNGTYVNDAEIHEAVPLRSGDRVQIGEHELTYSTEPASPSATPTGAFGRSTFAAPPPRTDPHVPAVARSADEDPTVPGDSLEQVENQPTIYVPGPGAVASTSEHPMDNAPSVPFALTTVATDNAPADETMSDVSGGDMSGGNPWDAFSPENLPATPEGTSAQVAERQDHAHDQAPLADDAPDATPAVAANNAATTAPPAFSTEPAPISAPPSMPKPGDSLIDHISAIQDYTARLRKRTETAEHLAAQRQQALAEARERVGAILNEQQRYASADSAEDLAPLIEITRQAVENPRHIDTVTQFSDHAQDILNVLQQRQAQQAAPNEAQRALEDLYAWLNRLG